MLKDPTITCVGDDGETTFEYYVLCGPDVASERVGWVLIVDGPQPLEPQYVTPTEIAGDLESMGVNDGGMHYFVRLGTEDMLTHLRSRVDADEASSATTRRITELERELHQLPSVTFE